MIWLRRSLVVAVAAVTVLGVGCSGDDDAAGSETTAPPTFDDLICLVVARYSHDLAEAVEQFNEDSAAATPAERRQFYLEAWDRVGAVNDSLEQALDELPPAGTLHGPPIRVAIERALADNREEHAYGVELANELPDSAYAESFVAGGSLVNGTEKMRAKVFLALQETAYRLGVDTFDGRCDAFTLLDADEGS